MHVVTVDCRTFEDLVVRLTFGHKPVKPPRNYQASGTVPCVPGYPDYNEDWVAKPKYGTTPDEIRHTVMAEWIAGGAQRLEPWTGVWFGLPSQVVPLDKTTPRAT